MPSPENLEIYHPIEMDKDLLALAASIKKHGLREHLVITEDNFIVSGHRRRLALQYINQKFVPCRVLPIRRDAMATADYVALLREHNRQRSKSVAEQVREELIDINPEDAYRNLCHLRDKSINAPEHNGVDILDIEGQKRRFKISGQKAEHVEHIRKVVFEDRRDYWPLSVRSVHYALLNYTFLRNIPRSIRYLNDDDSYQATSNLITRLRLDGVIPWRAFDDPTRPREEFRPFHNVRSFIQQETEGLFSGYWRDLLQSQPNHIEVLCEKNTVFDLALRVTRRYQIPTSSGRGFNSIDPWHDLYTAYKDSGKERLIVVVLSDFDPEGEMIPQVGGRTLRDDFGVEQLTIIKAGVTRQQIEEYDLPSQNFAKESSTNHDWFVNRNDGDDTVYELEALDPEDMLTDLEVVIKSVLDTGLFNREVEIEKQESVHIEAARKSAFAALKGLLD
jgi:hypothetical protein